MRHVSRILIAILLLAVSATAQAPPPVERLPKDVTFFFAWNGLGSMQKFRATNGLLRLWDDPEFATIRQILFDRAERDSKNQKPLNKEELDLILDGASNPFIFGFANIPAAQKPTPKAGKNAPTGLFFIYDQTGKSDVVEKLSKLSASNATTLPVVTTSTFSGVTITTEETERSISYSAVSGNYLLFADSREVMEMLIRQFTSAAPASVLATPAYQAAALQRSPDAFCEFFFRIPDLTKLELPPAQGMNLSAMIKGLHLERLQAVSASASLAGNGTRIRMAAIGDTSPGSVFDLVGASSGEFRTLALAPAGASYNATRFDLHAFYKTLRGAMQAGLNTEQATQLEMFEGLAGMQLGMGIPEALQIISGEIATISLPENGNDSDTGNALDQQRNLYAVSIERPDDVVKIIQLAAGKNLTSETREGNATVLSITMPYVDERTGAQRKRFNYVGITPNLLIVAPRKALLREALERATAQQGPASGGLAGDPAFQQVRNRLPSQLTSLSYADLSRFPWQLVVDGLIQEANKKESGKLAPQEEQALRAFPKLITRYLHLTFGGAWKDRNGIFMDSYIE